MNIRISAIALSLLIGYSFAADPRMEQGAIFEAKGNYEMALGEYRAMLAENPKNSEAYFAAAEVRVKMKDYSGALANYRLAYKFDPTMSAAYEGAAKVYEALGQKSKAADERAKDPKNRPVEEVAEAPVVAPIEASSVETPAAEPAKVAEAPKAEPKVEPAPVAEPKTEPAKVAEPAPAKAAEPVKAAEPAPAKVAEAAPAKKEEPKAAAPAPVEEKALPIDPFERGKALFAEQNYAEAAKAWREVLKKTPGHAGAYFYAGLTRFEMGEMDKAEYNLKKGLEYKEEGNEANYYLSLIYQKNSKVDQEQKFLAAYLKKAGPAAKNRRNAEERLAAIKAAKAEADKAAAEEKAAAAEKAAETKTAEAPAKDKAAQTAAKNAPQAAATETQTAEAAPAEAPVEPSVKNANLLVTSGSLEAALQMYKTLLETEQNPEERYFTMLQMGNIYREMRDFHSAVTRYREVVQQFPDSDWATEAERALEDAVWLEKHAKELPKRKR